MKTPTLLITLMSVLLLASLSGCQSSSTNEEKTMQPQTASQKAVIKIIDPQDK